MRKYCLPLILENFHELGLQLSSAEKTYTYMEIWLDYLKSIEETTLSAFIDRYPGRLILLLRRLQLQAVTMSRTRQQELISFLAPQNCLIDLDVSSQVAELEFLRSLPHKGQLIASYHNYTETPSDLALDEYVKLMDLYAADIYKFSCFCNTPEDAARLLHLGLRLKSSSKKVIVLGMGKYGSLLRVYGTLWMNELIFAPQDKALASAPGQLTYDELEAIFKIIDQ